MTTKQCSKCDVLQPITLFEIDISGYVRSTCHKCRLEQTQNRKAVRAAAKKIVLPNKACAICKTIKPIADFNKLAITSDGYDKRCRECFKKVRHRKKAPVTQTHTTMFACEMCKETKSNLEFRSTKRSKAGHFKICNSCWKPSVWNSDKQKASEKKYVRKNPDKIKEKWRKAALNPTRIIRDRLNHRIVDAMRSVNTRKGNTTDNYTGCTMPYLKKWFEYQFDDTINWQTYGEWHIDHVMPCSNYDLTNEEQQKICFNWQNLRPCSKAENMAKSDKIIPELIEQQKQRVSTFLEINPLPNQPGDRVGGTE